MTRSWAIHVIDDDEPVRNAIAFALEAVGYRIVTYADADDFLARGEAEHGFLISDVRMPGLTGIELTRRLRQDGSTMPIVLMTGNADAQLVAAAMSAGADRLLIKPIQLPAIVAEIKRATAGW